MLQLIYMSTADTPPTSAEMEALCEQASRNNGRNEISGVLLVHGSTFLQVLEGPKLAVEDTFLRVMADDRHHSLLLLSRKMTTTREFGAWSMAKCDGSADKSHVVDDVRSRLSNVPPRLRERFEDHFADQGSPATEVQGAGRGGDEHPATAESISRSIVTRGADPKYP